MATSTKIQDNTAKKHTKDIITKHFQLEKEQAIFIIYDTKSPLAQELKDAYQHAGQELEHTVTTQDYDQIQEDDLKAHIDTLTKGTLVVLIQSNSFRMSNYRLRVELFHRGLQVAEHVRLASNETKEQQQAYIAALTNDDQYYKQAAKTLKETLETTQGLTITTKDNDGNTAELTFSSAFEDVKENIGDFSRSLSRGTLYPIGEVFTESRDLRAVNGEAYIYAFPSMQHKTIITAPFKITIKNGCIIKHDGPAAYEELMQLIQTENEDKKIWMRELGLGLNRHINKKTALPDISAFERIKGTHISLGLKHGIYRKKVDKKINQKYHIDCFLATDTIKAAEDKTVFEKQEYILK